MVTKPKLSTRRSTLPGGGLPGHDRCVWEGFSAPAGCPQAGMGQLRPFPRDDVWEITLTHTLEEAQVSLSQMYLRIQGTLMVSAPPEFQWGRTKIRQQLASSMQWRSPTLRSDRGSPSLV